MENNIILSPIPVDQLTALLRGILKEEIRAKNEEELQAAYLSPQKTRKLFNPEISLVTLNTWSKKGLLNKHYISGRTYFLYSEVLEAVKSLKKYQH